MRLDKYLADCGVGTRAEVKKLIRSGAVSVTGIDKASADTKIDENSAEVFVLGTLLSHKKFVYLMLNKPMGCICATYDKKQKTVIELVPAEYSHFDLFPAGRLDIDTTGLCLLTNDGALSHKLLSPSKHIPKAYVATVDKELTKKDVELFGKPMDLGDFTAQPSKLEIISSSAEESVALVTISEGKFHQIKRMFEKADCRVTSLKRISMNKLKLDEKLCEGEMRELTEEELELLTYGID